jgi:phage gpG-like protein
LPSVSFPNTVNYELVGEDELLIDLVELEGYYQNTISPMRAGKLVAIQDTKEHFEEEQAPDGDGWEYWAESYQRRAEAENVGILRKYEDLYYAATNPSAYEITPEGLIFDAGELPEFWYTHQYGRDDKPMPARPFVGLSIQAENEIEGIFLKWIEDGGEVFMRGSKRVEAHVFRAPSGHFISALT